MLPFTAETYLSLIAQHNHSSWPAPLVGYALAWAAVLLALRSAGGGRVVAGLLGVGWAWTAVAFHWLHAASIDFSAPGYAVAFLFQAVLLGWVGVLRGGLAFRLRRDAAGWTGLALIAYALALQPLLGAWAASPLPGSAPGPTAVLTLGLLLLANRRHFGLAAIPFLWTLAAGATAWALGLSPDYVLPALGVAAIAAMAWTRRPPAA